jgi:hypothetical protein
MMTTAGNGQSAFALYAEMIELARFREQHPDVLIVAGNGWWQACLPEPAGETVVTRWTLGELLGRLGELTGSS